MQPGVPGRLDAEGKQRVLPVFGFATAEAAAELGARRIAVEPFGDTASECAGLGFVPRQAAVELGNARPFIEEGSDAAKAAAPYCHARLSATEVSGPNGNAVEVQTTQKLDISGLDDEELDILERALQKTMASQ
jgi:hypothetical protein